MKSFFQFLGEAESQASMQARKLNLKSDGHGSWLDTRGNMVATTEKGKLVFLDKKKAQTPQDATATQRRAQPQQDKETEKTKSETETSKKGKSSEEGEGCLLYTSPSPRDATLSRMPSSA